MWLIPYFVILAVTLLFVYFLSSEGQFDDFRIQTYGLGSDFCYVEQRYFSEGEGARFETWGKPEKRLIETPYFSSKKQARQAIIRAMALQ